MVIDAVSSSQSVRNPGAGQKFFIPQNSITVEMLTAATVAALELPPGLIVEGAGTTAPEGYLVCDGSAVSRSTYSNLFAAIGTTWGVGDGSTTFNIPDLRGLFTRMIDTSGLGRDPNAASRTAVDFETVIGGVMGSYQESALQTHVHAENIYQSGGDHARGGADGTRPISGLTNINSGPSGGNISSNETRPINAYVNKFIKY